MLDGAGSLLLGNALDRKSVNVILDDGQGKDAWLEG